METIISNYKIPITYDPSDLCVPDTNHVVNNVMREFFHESGYLEFSPSVSECETKLKTLFIKVFDNSQVHQKLQLPEVVRDPVRFEFSGLTKEINESITLMDTWLADNFLNFVSLHFFLHGFEHLFMDEKRLLDDEIVLLEKENRFGPLKNEISLLMNDLRYLEKIINHLYIGLLKVDVRDFKTSLETKVQNCISNVFMHTIYTKFESLLMANKKIYENIRGNLNQSIDTVQNYIEIKTFLDSSDLVDQIETIKRETRLCREINDFQTEYLVRTDALMLDYLMSLNWVRDLQYLQTDAKRRLSESGPKFVMELKRQSDELFSDLTMIQQQISKFPYYSDLIHAEHYYLKTLEINKQLDEMQTRAAEINKRQAVLESKETSFEMIETEIKGFSKYSQLWEFVSYRWTPNVERWWKGHFHDLNKFEMQSDINYGNDLLKRLYDEFHEMPKLQEIIKNKQTDVERHQNIYNHVTILKDPCFRDRHWDAFFNEVREQDKGSVSLHSKIDLKKISLSELMEMHLTSHTNFLKQTLIKARAEAVIEQSIKETKDNIKKITIKPRTFDMDNIGLSIIPNMVHLLATLNEHNSVCKNMLANPEYPDEFKKELANLVRLVSFTIQILKLIQKVQSKLIKFSPLFKFRDLTTYFTSADFVSTFLRVRQDFMEIMRAIFQKEMAFFINLLSDEHDDSKAEEIIKKLTDLNKQCVTIMDLLKQFFKVVRAKCPRYYFFSDDQMMMLCSLLKFPKSLFGLVSNLFKGIRSVEIASSDTTDAESIFVMNIKTKNGEQLRFSTPPTIDLSTNAKVPLISIINTMEESIKAHFVQVRVDHLLPIASLNLNFGEIFRYARNNTLLFQSIQLMMQIIFDFELLTLYKTSSMPNNRVNLYECLLNLRKAISVSFQEFFDHPSRHLEEHFQSPVVLLYYDNFLMCIQKLEGTLEYLIRSEALEFGSFDFQALPKYSIKFNTNLLGGVPLTDTCKRVYDQTNEAQLNSYASGVLTSSTSDIMRELYTHPSTSVTLNVMNCVIQYSDELLAHSSPLVLMPHFERTTFHLMMSAVNNNFVLLRGPSGTGKNSQIRSLAHLGGKNLYEVDCSMNRRLNQAASFVAGTITGGFWFTFRNLEACPNQLMSTISILVETVKHCVTEKVTIEGQSLLPQPGYCIFGTYRVSRTVQVTEIANIPISLLEIFRIVSLNASPTIGIISCLISPVIAYGGTLVWSNKLILYIKMCSKKDFNEELNSEDSRLAEESSNGRISLNLRVVCGLIRTALVKYYGHVQRQYEKFREPETGKWRLDISKLKILSDKDRKGIFTKLVIEAITEFLLKTEASKYNIKGSTDLLNELFKDDLESVKGHLATTMAPIQSKKSRERLIEIIKDFKESNWTLNLPQPAKTYSRIEQYVNLMLGLDDEGSGNHFLIYGTPNSQKSTIIKILSYIYSEWYQINFRKYWVLLDAVRTNYLFGFDGFSGILTEIFNQCHGLDLEDKSSQPKKINYLFQANSELYNAYADSRDQKKLKVAKELSRTFSWIIFDANGGKGNSSLTTTIANIVSMFSTLYEYKEINHFIGFSPNTKVFYELSSLGSLDPKVISSLKMIYQDSPLVDSKERVEIWLGQLIMQDSFFQMVSSRVTSIISTIVVPFIDKLYLLEPKIKPPIFLTNTSVHSMLSGFLSLFEVMLNEFRKFHVIHEYEVMKEHPQMISANKAEVQSKMGGNAWRPIGPFNNQMKLAQQAQNVNFIQARAGRVPHGSVQAIQVNHYLTGIESAEDIEEWETRRLEALAIFSMLYSIYGNIYESRREIASKVFEEVVFAYIKKSKVQKSSFACGYYNVVEQKKYSVPTEYSFDLTKGIWIKWTDTKFKAISEISSSFSMRTFSRIELDRMNCQNYKLMAQTEIAESSTTLETLVGLKEKMLVQTSEVNMLNFFVDYYVSYNRHLTVISEHQQGKSLILTSILRKIIEQNRILTFNFQLQRGTNPVVMQSHIESNLLKEVGNVLKPPKKKTAVVWLDDVHMSGNDGKIESLLRNLQVQGGWFSYQGKSFYKVVNTVFLLSMSVRENDSLASQEAVNAVNLDILSKCTTLKMRRLNREEFVSIFADTVSSQITSTPSSSKRVEEGVTSGLFKQLVQLVYFNLDQIRKHTNYRMLNLNVDNFYQLAKSINCVSWKDVNQDKRNVQYVWYFILRDFFSCDLAFQLHEYKVLLERMKVTRSLIDIEAFNPMTPGPQTSQPILKRAGSRTQWPSARRKSMNNNNQDKTEEDIVRRIRGGSMHMDDAEEVVKHETKTSRFAPVSDKNTKMVFKFKKAEVLDTHKHSATAIKPSKSHEYSEKSENRESDRKIGSQDDLLDKESNSDLSPAGSPGKMDESVDNQSIDADDNPPNVRSKVNIVLPENSRYGEDDDSADSKSNGGWSESANGVKKSKLSPFAPKKSKFFQVSQEPNNERLSPSKRNLGPSRPASAFGSDSGAPKALTIRDANEEDGQLLTESSSDESAEYVYKDPKSASVAFKSRFLKDKDLMTEVGKASSPNRKQEKSVISPFGKDKKPAQKDNDSLNSSIVSSSHSGSGNESPTNKDNAFKILAKDPLNFFEEFIAKAMNKGEFKSVGYDKLKYSVYTNKKYLFDVAVQESEDNNEFDKDYEMFQHSFEILDQKMTEQITSYLKQAIENYTTSHPEAIFSLQLDNTNFGQFLSDFTRFHLAMRTEFHHLMLTSIKACQYATHMIGLICECLGDTCVKLDLLLDDSCSKTSGEITFDAFKAIKGAIKDNFEKMIKNNKRLIFVINIPSLEKSGIRQAASKVFDIASAIIFNTDMTLEYFSDQIHDFISQLKKHRLSSHYDEFFATYIIRNKLEAKVTFVFIHEDSQEELFKNKIKQVNESSNSDVFRFMAENYSRLSTKLRKIVINGLRMPIQAEAAASYLSEEVKIGGQSSQTTRVLLAAQTLEMNYLKRFEKDLGGFYSVRSVRENLILFKFITSALNKKFAGKNGENDNETLIKEQRVMVQRINRRKEMLVYEINQLGQQIDSKQQELLNLSQVKIKMETSYQDTHKRREGFGRKIGELKREKETLLAEDDRYRVISGHLTETQSALLEIKEKEFLTNLSFGAFMHSQTFTLYSILYHEFYCITIEPKLSTTELERLNVTNISLSRFALYATNMVRILEDTATFKQQVKEFNSISYATNEKLEAMLKVIANTGNVHFAKLQADQRLLLFWIDLLIDTASVQRNRADRENKINEIEGNLTILEQGIKQCDQVTQSFTELRNKEAKMTVEIEESIRQLKATRIERETAVKNLGEFLEELLAAQALYLRTTSPFLAYNLDKTQTIEVLAAFISICSKYPYQVKRTMFFNLLKGLDMQADLFNEVPVYDFLSTEPPFMSALNSKIPFNLNMLNNASILQLLHDSCMPYAVVKDSSGLFARWLEHKYARFLCSDYMLPGDKILEEIEVCLVNGQPYLAVDPNEDLLRIIKPIIEWRFRRFCETMITQQGLTSSPTLDIFFNQKKIIVKDGFRVIIVLQKSTPECFDPSVLSQMFFVNNDFSEKKIWNETLTEELIINMENTLRNQYIQGFVDNNLNTKIYDRYHDLANLLANFDIISDSLTSDSFRRLILLVKEVTVLANKQNQRLEERKANLMKNREEIGRLAAANTEKDVEAETFMNNHYAVSIPGYFQLFNKYNNLSDRLRIYYTAIDKFRVYLGDKLAISQENFVYLFKECIQAFKKELELRNTPSPEATVMAANGVDITAFQPQTTKEIPSEQLEAVFNKIERTFYNQIMNSIPQHLRFIYAFLCTVAHMLSQPDVNKRTFLKSLYLFLFSEKVIPKQNRNLSFVNSKLYDRFNLVYRSLKQHFIYSSSNMPNNVDLMDEFDTLMQEANNLDDLRSNFRFVNSPNLGPIQLRRYSATQKR